MAERTRTVPRWLTGLLVGGALMLLAGGVWFYESQRRFMRAEAEADLASIASSKVAQIAAWRAQRLNDAAVIAQSVFFVRAAQRWLETADPQLQSGLLDRLRATCTYYGYDNVTLVDTQGQARLRVVAAPPALTPKTDEAVMAALQSRRPLITELHRRRSDGRPHLEVIAPLFVDDTANAAPVGAVVLQVNAADSLYPLVQSWPTESPSAESLLVRRDGDDALFLNEVRHRTNTALNLRIPLSQTNVPAVLAVRGRRGVVDGLDYRGVPVLSVLKPVPNSNWLLVTKIDRAEALAAWQSRAVLILALLFVLTGGLAAIVGLVWQRRDKAHYRQLFQAEAARSESEARYRTTLLSVGDAVIVTDAAGRVELFNPVAETLTGWPLSEARGRPLEEVFRIVNQETHQTVESPATRVLREGVIVGLANHTILIGRDGRERPIADSGAPIHDAAGAIVGVVLVFRDVTAEDRHQRERELTLALLRILNQNNALPDLIHRVTAFLQEQTGFEAVGVRLSDGDDFPYYEARGFPSAFVQMENSLCLRGPDGRPLCDGQGHPVLECMCGNILCGRFDPSLPFFTARGSFWTNSTTDLLASSTETARQARTRNRCNGEGYESVALIRLRAGEQTLGLLQFNDHAKGRFTPDRLAFLENAADQIAIAVAQRRASEALTRSEARFRTTLDGMLEGCQIIGFDGCYRYVNDAAVYHARQPREALLGQRIADVFPGIDQTPMFAVLTHCLTHRTAVQMENEFVYPDGAHAWFQLNMQPVPEGVFILSLEITARKQAEQALAGERQFMRTLIDTTPDLIFVRDAAGRFTLVNAATRRQTGAHGDADLLGKTVFEIMPQDRAAAYDRDDRQVLASGLPLLNREELLPDADGRLHRLLVNKIPLRDAAGAVSGLLGVGRDITELSSLQEEKSRMEEQLRQAQKMESIGRLAGGVAHDFNNMLQAILGHTELALDEAPDGTPLHETLLQVQLAATRSAEMTRKLLAFARKQTVQPRVLNLNDSVTALIDLLRRLIGEAVTLSWRPGQDLWLVRIDPSQVDQILTNLAVNARDAIAGAGQITITTANVTFDASFCRVHADLSPGDHVVLTVSDTGSGMDPVALAHAFEPFFTTKAHGTGLGLATVYGITRQNHGAILAESAPGQGSSFRVCLPRHRERHPAVAVAPPEPAHLLNAGTETILVVEDEPLIRRQVEITLRRLGYQILTAATPGTALKLAREYAGTIHLLLTDVVMPEMDGRQLADQLDVLRPGLRRLFMSGYASDVLARGGILPEGLHFIPKPFTTADIADKIRRVLEN